MTSSCDLILHACQGAGSIVYRLSESKPVTPEFVGQVFNLPAVLPPQSMLLFAQMFSSLEEVLFRGVLLTMLLRAHGPRHAIVFSASAPVRALYGVVFGYGLAAMLMMLWVRFFAARWLLRPFAAELSTMRRVTTRRERA